jgi:2-methylcitrate dehydratase PrpD
VQALARNVSASIDPALGEGTEGSPARLKITFKDGQVLEHRREHATGSKQVPMTQAQLDDKFTDCAVHAVHRDTAGKILTALKAMPGRPSFDDLWPLLRKA